MLNNTYNYYNGVGNSQSSSKGLPLQTIPKHKKTEAWKRECMDRLEEIGQSQVVQNIEFRDYYRMLEGSVVYADYQPAPEVTRDIIELRNEIDLPSFIKHFDLTGVIINQLIGEYDNHQDKIRIDSLDEYAQNEYTRTKNHRIKEYIQQSFEIEIQAALARDGFPIDQQEFTSEEEQQQYLEALEVKRAEIIPPAKIQKALNKDFKVRIVEWAEHTYEADRKKFSLGLLEKKELKDYLLTGRYFRHYKIGYDSYKPEHWKVEETFFSQDLDIEYPQHGEYVGRVFNLSASATLQRYGHLLTHNEQVQISKEYSSTTGSGTSDDKYNITKPNKRPVKQITEPLGYQTLELTEQFQDAFQQSLVEATFVDESGEDNTVPYWITGYNDGNGKIPSNFSTYLRDDINVRTDTYQITEAYWRGWSLIAFLYYEDERGIPDMVMVTEDILKDFIKENEIKQLRTVTIEDFSENPEVNSIAYTYVPAIYQGKKIKGVGSGKTKDIYFDIKELPYQVKGDSDDSLYDLQLPVAGIIHSSFAKKIRPYQFVYNVAMNQITNLLEKEIGMFFLMDINFLPSEFKDMGDSKDMLLELRDMAKEIGFIPTDTSQQNLQGGSSNSNNMIPQNITYANEVQYRLQLAETYKLMALEQIGITPQRIGSPTHGETAEGIRQGVTASYAQTDNIYTPFNEANRKAVELHLTVAQYAQKTGKDISFFYRKEDSEIATMTFSDEKFHLRHIGVIPVSDAKTRKNIEQLRSVLLNNNTMGSDMLEYAELFTADSMVELISIGRRNRQERQQESQQEHQQQMEQLEMESQLREEEEVKTFEREESSKERDRQVDLEEARIRAIGASIDNNADDSKVKFLIDELNRRDKKEISDQQIAQKTEELNHRREEDTKDRQFKEQEMALKVKALQAKMEEIKSKERIAKVNKN